MGMADMNVVHVVAPVALLTMMAIASAVRTPAALAENVVARIAMVEEVGMGKMMKTMIDKEQTTNT